LTKYSSLFLILCLILSLSVFLAPVSNPDVYWHLSAGRYIVEHQALPSADFLSHTMGGSPWIDFEWLTQLIYYGLYAAWGFAGLIALRVLLFGGLFWIFLRVLKLYGAGHIASGLAALSLALLLLPTADVRPDNFSLLFFSLILYRLEAARLSQDRSRPRDYLFCSLLFCLWANIHMGFIYGLVLILFYGHGALLAAGAFATLLNPFGPRLYSVLIQHLSSLKFLQVHIAEWLPADATIPWMWPYWALIIIAFSITLLHYLKTRRTPYAHLLTLFYFGLSSAESRRHIPFFCLPALAYTAGMLKDFNFKPAIKRWAGALLFLLLFLQLGRFLPILRRELMAREKSSVDGSCRFLKEQAQILAGKKLFNTWADGGALGFALEPAYKIFMDGRYIFHSLLQDSYKAGASPLEWQDFMSRHGIEVAILKRSQKNVVFLTANGLVYNRPYFIKYMPGPTWAMVFWDANNMIMARRSAVDPRWLNAHEYKYLLPDDGPALSQKIADRSVSPKALELESERHRRETGDILAQ